MSLVSGQTNTLGFRIAQFGVKKWDLIAQNLTMQGHVVKTCQGPNIHSKSEIWCQKQFFEMLMDGLEIKSTQIWFQKNWRNPHVATSFWHDGFWFCHLIGPEPNYLDFTWKKQLPHQQKGVPRSKEFPAWASVEFVSLVPKRLSQKPQFHPFILIWSCDHESCIKINVSLHGWQCDQSHRLQPNNQEAVRLARNLDGPKNHPVDLANVSLQKILRSSQNYHSLADAAKITLSSSCPIRSSAKMQSD